MKITVAAVAGHSRSSYKATDCFAAEYVERASRYVPTDLQLFDSEAACLESIDRSQGRIAAYLVLLDSRGQLLTSKEFAERLGTLRDSGTQRVVLAVGPADGWSLAARERANLLFSLGRITLPHQLARVVLAEQVYRAFTILAGHPYHCGH